MTEAPGQTEVAMVTDAAAAKIAMRGEPLQVQTCLGRGNFACVPFLASYMALVVGPSTKT